MIKLVVFVPLSHADTVREALARAGAGRLGNYRGCSFSSRGIGRFTPVDGASPAIGEIGVAEAVDEERIEVVIEAALVRRAIAAMRAAHPYEEPAYDLYRLLDEDDLD